ncbi:MAG: 50S ribosomal protein L32 [Candidatus Omnitrophica bacterium]|nr:50S ribosomal protein L32 [Candidatus Omnitrophota bacterium]
MPLPKRRHSVQRGRKRRTHWKLKAASTSVCPQCKQPKLPHKVCGTCGHYGGREAVAIKTKAEKKEKK